MWYPCMHAVCGLTVLVTILNRLSLCASCQHLNSVMVAHIGSSANHKLFQAYFYTTDLFQYLGIPCTSFIWLYLTIPNPYSTKCMPLRSWETLDIVVCFARQVRGEKYVGRNGWEDEESVITNYHFLPWPWKIASVIAESVEQELTGEVSLCLFLERAE